MFSPQKLPSGKHGTSKICIRRIGEHLAEKETPTMKTFLALYRGKAIRTAKLVAVTIDPGLVSMVADHLLRVPEAHTDDPILEALAQGERHALHWMTQQATDRSSEHD
jgi:hypothetical protein